MLEKIDYILFKKATTPINTSKCNYSWMPSACARGHSYLQPSQTSPSLAIWDITIWGHTRQNSHLPYKTSLSPALRDITISGHMRHYCPQLYKTSPSGPCKVHHWLRLLYMISKSIWSVWVWVLKKRESLLQYRNIPTWCLSSYLDISIYISLTMLTDTFPFRANSFCKTWFKY